MGKLIRRMGIPTFAVSALLLVVLIAAYVMCQSLPVLFTDILRRVSVAAYEAEMNLVIHSLGGTLSLMVDRDAIILTAQDLGPGIPDIETAMRAGFSTADDKARGMGFGAGMGLPNIRRNADAFSIRSTPGIGTRIEARFTL